MTTTTSPTVRARELLLVMLDTPRRSSPEEFARHLEALDDVRAVIARRVQGYNAENILFRLGNEYAGRGF